MGRTKSGAPQNTPCSRFLWHACSRHYYITDGIDADYLLADSGYDTYVIIEQVSEVRMEAVMPPKKNRKLQRKYDKDTYENRYHVDNTFLKMKRWRRIATIYAKTTSSYKSSVLICCMFMWLNIL